MVEKKKNAIKVNIFPNDKQDITISQIKLS